MALALFRQIKLAIWNCLTGRDLLEFSNEPASKEPERYGAALTRFLIKNGLYIVEVNRLDRSKRRLCQRHDL
ncbi:hypothetical protein PCO85_05445 [Prodigiosinella aquatilis]|nr:hypothetical protein [Prodigiosinella sp. LS101]WJV54874.1 hypothetical protein PCO85_05445 [Prodigiosinella sp. LS101]WJV59237.1 hypothetical protein PCO84_05455 [Pectobacteriaceae bacterium C111]